MTDTTDAIETADPSKESPVEAMYANMGMQVMFDLAAPQPNYKTLIEEGGYVEAMPGMGLSFKRENTEFVLRHNEFFSNHAESFGAGLRPLVPLNVDPPRHGKYRKLLDPLFAPKRMNELEAPSTQLVNDLIDAFGDAEEIDFTAQFSVRSASAAVHTNV